LSRKEEVPRERGGGKKEERSCPLFRGLFEKKDKKLKNASTFFSKQRSGFPLAKKKQKKSPIQQEKEIGSEGKDSSFRTRAEGIQEKLREKKKFRGCGTSPK